MAGILIYTASGDSEGTLGGLVRQEGTTHSRAYTERQSNRQSFVPTIRYAHSAMVREEIP